MHLRRRLPGFSAAFCLLAMPLWLGCARSEGYIKIKGSETVLPISLKLAEHFTETPGLPGVSVTAGGSGVGIAALLADNTDIAMSSREIKFEEVTAFKLRGLEFVELVIGFDALAIIVHKNNPVDSLTMQQAKAIFQGKVTNWKQVGGADQRIVAFNRESSSGTYEFFKKKILEKEDFAALQTVGANGELIEKVAHSPATVGYVGIAYVNPRDVKPLRIYNEKLRQSISPTIENSLNKTYPLVRPLYFYYLKKREKAVAAIINYMKTQTGQELVRAAGYPPNPEFYRIPQSR
ncbi:MAG: phosphate ABC transporter substrate-binding protein [Bacteroidetes bacterium]|nr:phosphate ABC transporter substrate-binding protein [Bacteroidota bacterium]